MIITKTQRENIATLRRMGRSYEEIGKAMGIHKGTIKTFCWRNNIKPDGAPSQQEIYFCRECGKTIVQKPKMKKRFFCCDACGYKWWKEHPERINRKAIYSFTCAGCGQPFTAYGNNKRKFCSHQCYINTRFKGGDPLV